MWLIINLNILLADWVAVNAGITAEQAQWLKQFTARIASGESYSEPARVSKRGKEAREQRKIRQAPHRLQASQLDHELNEFTTHSRATASASLDAEDASPSGMMNSHPPPLSYNLDDHIDVTEEPLTGVPTALPAPQQPTDEQLNAEVYGSNKE